MINFIIGFTCGIVTIIVLGMYFIHLAKKEIKSTDDDFHLGV
jgi:hypothetical protein